MEPEIILGRKLLDTRHFGPDLCLGKFCSFDLPTTSVPNNSTGETAPDLR